MAQTAFFKAILKKFLVKNRVNLMSLLIRIMDMLVMVSLWSFHVLVVSNE